MGVALNGTSILTRLSSCPQSPPVISQITAIGLPITTGIEMTTDIATQIKHIKSEVRELHPLLDEVFKRHQHILRSEYTHGPAEKGADFVLTRRHEVLNREEYIGVIAKVGKIHQNHRDVADQVEECLTLSRHLEEGKKKIHLTEVWVIATSTITAGAKGKIHAVHKASKVHFVSGRDLATLVEKWVPYYWSNVPVETSSYLNDVRTMAREQDERLDLLQVPGERLYIDQDIDRVIVDPYTRGAKRARRRTKIDPLVEIESHRFMLIEAGMGGGKSKLIRHLLQSTADEALSANRPWLPVSTTYKTLVDDYDNSLTACLDAAVPTVVREQLPDDARIIFFVDALDEKEQSQPELFASLDRVAEETAADPRYRLILTSRIIGNLEFDKQFANAISRYEIRRLTIAKFVKYLRAVCEQLNLTTRIINDIQRSPLFARLPQNPLAAVLLARVLRDNRQDLPATLPELYAKYMELALGRWDIDKGLQSQQEYEVIQTVLMELAQYVLENDLEAISAAEFRQRIITYLDQRNLRVDPEAVFNRAVERSEILVASPAKDILWFKHRSFAEFLEARRRVRGGTVAPSLKAFEMYWANIYYFACGEMKDAPELIRGLAALLPEDEQHRWLKPINLANYLMAAYATPYETVEHAVYRAMVDAAKLFCDVVNGRQRSYFRQLSRMDLLCLMQLMIRDHYGFEFLGSALESAAIRVMEEDLEEIGPYCLFLLAVASVDAGREDAFETLLEDYRDELPIDVSLGVVHEGNTRSSIIRRFARRVKKKRKGNQRLNRDIALLYDRPISRMIGEGEK